MTEWIITSCVLIAMILGVRFLLKDRISGRLRYGLWLLVLIRLLIPFSLPSDMSVMNLLPEKAPEAEDAPEILEQEAAEPSAPEALPDAPEELLTLPEDGSYTTKEDVALYIYLYGGLPDNFITKKEAEALGWEGGSVERYAPGKCIGGDKFGNREGLLPKAGGRQYYECDIDTLGANSRGAKRIVFSNDGLIYYTDDHYESFELLYTKEGPQ